MSQNSNNNSSKIVNSWSLMAFARAKGPKMQVGEFTNKESGDKFKSCIFTDKEGERTFAAFSSKLGELTPRQIVEQKNELQVVELETEGYENHHFALCKQGQNSWEDVDLGL